MTNLPREDRPPLKVLIVEDDPVFLRTVVLALKTKGYDVRAASDGPECLKRINESIPDIIVCDIAMPEMDGYAVLRELRKRPDTAVIPFIFLSGRADRSDVRTGMGMGADDYLTKPVDAEELIASIEARHQRDRLLSQRLVSLRNEIAAAVPNQFLTPLHSILGFSLLILDALRAGETVSREELLDSVGSIQEAGEQLLRIASNHVLYTYLNTIAQDPGETNRLRLSRTQDWIEDLSVKLRTLAMQYNRVENLQIAFAPATLRIDRQHLEKLLTEITDNALKFSPPASPVRLTGNSEGDYYVFTLSDRGTGMTAAQIHAISSRNHLETPGQTKNGFPLGLSIAKKIADVYGGSLELANAPESGTVATLRIPAE